ncbi:MAG: hypothetical protein F6K39_42595 [Okeania sp. SIO3B3]|nr:hypothetical protein [Okeania sp. SIO3B3]
MRQDDWAEFQSRMNLAAKEYEGLYEAEYYLARWEVEKDFPATIATN